MPELRLLDRDLENDMKRPNKQRLLFLLAGFGGALVLIVAMTVIFPAGSSIAVLLLDHHDGDAIFRYPFTVQNLTWLLFGIGIGDVIHRRLRARIECRALGLKLLPEDPKTVLVPQDLPPIRLKLSKATELVGAFLCRLIDECILYFNANPDPGQTMQLMTTVVDMEGQRLELRYTLLRYLAWVIPTIGFIGTVIGIAGALSHLGPTDVTDLDMGAIVGSLSVAFNTTIVALSLSAVLVLLIQVTQSTEEDALNDSGAYCLKNLINRLYLPKS